MTPIQKAKEIWISIINAYKSNTFFEQWLATPEAAALLSGEGWKEDGVEPITIDFNTRVVVTDNKGRTIKYKLVEVDH